ncbi:MAG: hypothetical protein WD971_01600 [Pirellulales bacterium]
MMVRMAGFALRAFNALQTAINRLDKPPSNNLTPSTETCRLRENTEDFAKATKSKSISFVAFGRGKIAAGRFAAEASVSKRTMKRKFATARLRQLIRCHDPTERRNPYEHQKQH